MFDSVDNIWTTFDNVLRKGNNASGKNGRSKVTSNISQESGYDTSRNDKKCTNNDNDSNETDSEYSDTGTRVLTVDGEKVVFFRAPLQSEV